MVPCPAFCPKLFVENTRARPTHRAEGDPFQCRERAGRAQGSRGSPSRGPGRATSRRETRITSSVYRVSTLDCPCTFPVADLRPWSQSITVTPSLHAPMLTGYLYLISDGYQHSLTVPYHTTLSAHHPNRTTTPVSIFVQPPPSQSSRYLHPVLLSA